MKALIAGWWVVMLSMASIAAAAAPPTTEAENERLAKLAQNPVGNLISVPFQDNVNFNSGDLDGTQNVLNIQPVIPIALGADWTLITRTILPVITQPATSTQGKVSGLGDLQFSAFLSPATPKGGTIWGVGAILQAPTHTDKRLGNANWGMGPSVVVLRLEKGNPWVYGALVNNVFSTSSSYSTGNDTKYSNFLVQPFLNYNFKGGLYLTSAPIITAAWKAPSGEKWVFPLGGGIGKIFHLGKLPLNTQASAYYNVVRPTDSANWQLRLQVQAMFPK